MNKFSTDTKQSLKCLNEDLNSLMDTSKPHQLSQPALENDIDLLSLNENLNQTPLQSLGGGGGEHQKMNMNINMGCSILKGENNACSFLSNTDNESESYDESDYFFIDRYNDDQIKEIVSIFRNDFKPPKNLWIERNTNINESFHRDMDDLLPPLDDLSIPDTDNLHSPSASPPILPIEKKIDGEPQVVDILEDELVGRLNKMEIEAQSEPGLPTPGVLNSMNVRQNENGSAQIFPDENIKNEKKMKEAEMAKDEERDDGYDLLEKEVNKYRGISHKTENIDGQKLRELDNIKKEDVNIGFKDKGEKALDQWEEGMNYKWNLNEVPSKETTDLNAEEGFDKDENIDAGPFTYLSKIN
jgi:hypothetical protein